jgi:hypothetical protein
MSGFAALYPTYQLKPVVVMMLEVDEFKRCPVMLPWRKSDRPLINPQRFSPHKLGKIAPSLA